MCNDLFAALVQSSAFADAGGTMTNVSDDAFQVSAEATIGCESTVLENGC